MTHTYYPPATASEEMKIEVSLKKLGLPVLLKNLSSQCFTRKSGSEDWVAVPVCPAQEADAAKREFLMKCQ